VVVEPRVAVEELNLSIRAYHVLKTLDMDFIDQINLDALNHPWGREVRPEIAARLRRWPGGPGDESAPSRR
jgi:GGDEF domain-containing protein